MSAQHTPTPWELSVYNHATQTTTIIGPADGHGGRPIVCDACEQSSGPDNAAFIVRACNAHDELVAAAVRVLTKRFIPGVSETSDLGALADAVAKAGVQWQPQTSKDACELAHAALAKAGAA